MYNQDVQSECTIRMYNQDVQSVLKPVQSGCTTRDVQSVLKTMMYAENYLTHPVNNKTYD